MVGPRLSPRARAGHVTASGRGGDQRTTFASFSGNTIGGRHGRDALKDERPPKPPPVPVCLHLPRPRADTGEKKLEVATVLSKTPNEN